MNTKRVIAHIDLDSFYASVECLYNPDIRHLPVAVGGDAEKRHGIILAKNQLAKKYGVKTGEPLGIAKQKCPNIVFVKAHFDRYIKISGMVRDIYKEYTDKIEPFGIDEAWIDITESSLILGSPVKVVQEIQERIHREIGITASVGLSYNKIFAKLGSDQNKPYGLFVVTEANYKEKVWTLPASDLLYVGRATAQKLERLNIKTIGDLAIADPTILQAHLGKNGLMLKAFANGDDRSHVQKFTDESFVKSVGNSMTLPKDVTTNEEVLATFHMLAESVARRLRNQGLKCNGIQISVRDKNLITLQMQDQLNMPTFLSQEIAKKSYEIYLKKYLFKQPIRSIGIKAIDLTPIEQSFQLNLLYDTTKIEKLEALEKTVDSIRDAFGYEKIQKGILLADKKLNGRDIRNTHTIFPKPYLLD